jgi:hypothetical protein
MQTARQLIKYVSGILNDQELGSEFVVWSEGFLLAALNEGAAYCSSRFPWMFREPLDLILVAGVEQYIAPEYRAGLTYRGQVCTIRGVESLRTGALPIERTTGDEMMACDTGSCASDGMFSTACAPADDPCGSYRVKNYKIDPGNTTQISVYPPVPLGVSAKIRLSYVKPPEFALDNPLYAVVTFVPVIVDWMLFRAYSVDIRTEEVRERSNSYRKAVDESLVAFEKAYRANSGGA